MRNLLLALLFLTCTLAGCYLKSFPLNPQIAGNASYKIYSEAGSATAWVVDAHHVVTAGHFCEASLGMDIAMNNLTKHIPLETVEWELSDYNGRFDLCVLKSEVELTHPLIIASQEPKPNDPIYTVGYPLGKWTSSSGVYLGDLDPGEGESNTWNDSAFNAYCDHGSSGSAVYTLQGVVGVEVRFRTDGNRIHDGSDGCVMVKLGDLRDFLDELHINYTLTPELPSEPNEPSPLG